MNGNDKQHRAILQSIAHRVMIERGLLPEFSPQAMSELGRLQAPAAMDGEPVRDLRSLLWASIDNDDSRDLDQLTVAEAMPGDKIKNTFSGPRLERRRHGPVRPWRPTARPLAAGPETAAACSSQENL